MGFVGVVAVGGLFREGGVTVLVVRDLLGIAVVECYCMWGDAVSVL